MAATLKDMAYVITALSTDGEINETYDTAEGALEAALRHGSRGCRMIRIRAPDGEEHNLTSLHRSLYGMGI